MATSRKRRSRKASTSRKSSPPRNRASWRGDLRFGLVTFSVQAVNAHISSKGAIAFHQLHAECGRRIHYQKVCPVHGEITNRRSAPCTAK
jgi:non-homologous end joining protein Ku